MRLRRYQLKKDAIAILGRGHPWIFRDQLSTAASVFRDGDWLRLVDGANKVVGHGIYEAAGAVAIRLLRRGPEPVTVAYLKHLLDVAVERRGLLAERTTGMRLVHGESDALPAVVIDRFGETLVATSYSAGADALPRFAASYLARTLPSPPTSVLLRPAHRRRTDGPRPRVLRGTDTPLARFHEDGIDYAVDLSPGGQKTGTYLDLRGLRQVIASLPLAGARVLNLFAYSGMLGRAAEGAGAAQITQVDQSERALAFAAAHHVVDAARHRFLVEDVFQWLPGTDGVYDLVIVDPPSMTSKMAQVPKVLAAYRKLYRAAARVTRPGGVVVAACCTSRIDRATFNHTVAEALGTFKKTLELAPEPDHPVTFPESDYLKISLWTKPG